MPRATSRPYTTNPHDIFEAVICIHGPCPIRSGLTVGYCYAYVEIEGLLSHELIFDQRNDNLQREKQLAPRAAS